MPRSAIAAGCVDFVLSPARIAHELARLATHPYVASPKIAPEEAKEIEHEDSFKKVLAMLRRATGTDFSAYKPATLHRRLHRRMVLGKFKDLPEYISYLGSHPSELEALGADFLIGVTNFFRDPAAFDLLKKKVFPKLLEAHRGKSNGEALRVWVLGCSTGQEAYSIAMSWLEFAETKSANLPLQIFATDIHNPYLDRARAGIYSKSLLQDVSPQRLRKFFTEVEGGYRVNKAIREMCVFAKQNVVSDPPFSHIDLVSCRNLLIYLRPELQKKIIPIFHFALRPTGFLFLGPAETANGFLHLFTPVDTKVKLFAKKPAPPQIHARFVPLPWVPPKEERGPTRPGTREPTNVADAQHEADRLMLAKHAPAGVIVSENLEVIQFRGYTGLYLEPQPGKASLNLLKMAREGLFSPLRSAIAKAQKNNAPVKTPGVTVKQNGRLLTVNLEVIPLKNSAGEQRCFLITFEPVIPERASKLARKAAAPGRKSKALDMARLIKELAATKEHLQSVIEQQDAYNEELQSSNEEAQASNEELQSINEEMETAKEELQASNEELTTVNEELHTRNHELAVTSSDLTNLFSSVNMPMVMLGRDLRIRRFNGPAEKILNIASSDVGRPITDLSLNVSIPDLDQSLTQVIDTVTATEREVQDRQGRWHMLRMRPYMTADKKIDGAVMMLVDVDELKRNAAEIAQSRDYAQKIIETMSDSLLVLDQKLIVQSANRAFYEMFRVSPQETEKHYIYSLGNGNWNIPPLRQLLEEMLPQNQEIHDFEIEHEFPRIGHRIVRVNAHRFTLTAAGRELILLAISDITERGLAERKLHVSERRYRRLFEASKDGVLILDPVTRKITDANPFMSELLGYSRDELLGKELWQIGLLEDRAASEAAVRELQERGIVRYEDIPLQTKRGERREIEMVANVYREDGHEVIQCNIHDVTSRRRVEAALRESEERFRRLVQDLTDFAVVMLDTEGNIASWNEGAERTFGYKPEEIVGQHFSRLFIESEVHEGRPARVLRTAATEGRVENDHWLRRKDGNRFWGNSITSLRKDDTGAPCGYVKVLRDLTRRKEMEESLNEARIELQRHNAELEREVAARTEDLRKAMRELEAFSYSIAHDLRAPLRGMHGFARELLDSHASQLDEQGQNYLQRIARAATRLDVLIQEVLNFSRVLRDPVPLKRLDLDQLMREVIASYPDWQPPKTEIQIQGPLPAVQGHEGFLTQCISNLIGNAVKFVPSGTTPKVRIRTEEREGGFIRIWFEDNGIGIAPQNQTRIFRMFDRINAASDYEGTGIGLAIVSKSVERMGGNVGVESELGKGSRFWIELQKSE
jgi:PAS domain S-box-containing protein